MENEKSYLVTSKKAVENDVFKNEQKTHFDEIKNVASGGNFDHENHEITITGKFDAL